VSDVPDIYGVWRLQSYYLENMETAERTEVFGPKPNGVLILLPEGRMAAIITPTEQRQPTTEADEASAFRNLITYSGLYRLEPPDRFVTTVDVAWFQPWTGSQQARRFALHDDTLEIVSDPHRLPLAPDALTIAVVVGPRRHREPGRLKRSVLAELSEQSP
jgi:hypothetical protein